MHIANEHMVFFFMIIIHDKDPRVYLLNFEFFVLCDVCVQ